MRRCAHECVCWAMVEYGDAECPGRCDAYAPMVDMDALLALADELEEDACWEVQSPGVDNCAWRLKDTCDRIREALGVQDA